MPERNLDWQTYYIRTQLAMEIKFLLEVKLDY
jgi:hypothetical protein